MPQRYRSPAIVAALWALLFLFPAQPAPAGQIQHVIHISVDGLRADYLEDLINNDTMGQYANFKRFVTEGATTFNARTDYTHTITLPNHTTMITGRPVLQPAGQPNTVHHGYTSNTDPAPTNTLHNTGNLNIPYKASTFDVAHDNGLSTALYASKTKFVLFEHSYDATAGAPDTTGADDGRDKIDTYVNESTGSPATAANLNVDFVAGLGANHWRYAFVHYVDPDAAGHAFGWGSTAWNNAVKNVNDYLGALFNLIETDQVLAGHTVIIVTTDHGGTGYDHSNASIIEDYRIPFLVWGPGVPAGADLYALNAGLRQDPGTGRPDYNASPPPIRNGDSGNLALLLLSLPAIPGSTINVSQDLTAITGEVPAVSRWGMIVIAVLTMGTGVAVIIKRSRGRSFSSA